MQNRQVIQDGQTTEHEGYTTRLVRLQSGRVKTALAPVNPYRWNIRRLCRGRVLDVGCGIGRNLRYLGRQDAVGVDHNEHSVDIVRALGYAAHTPRQFEENASALHGSFDTILVSHVLEHLEFDDAVTLVGSYLPALATNGRVVVICPQQRGYASDHTHVTYFDEPALRRLAAAIGLDVVKYRSFPLPRFLGGAWIYNEHILVLSRQG